jgi:hypothetical protein
MDTDCGGPYPPDGMENVGASTKSLIVYEALETVESLQFVKTAKALRVWLDVITKGSEY